MSPKSATTPISTTKRRALSRVVGDVEDLEDRVGDRADRENAGADQQTGLGRVEAVVFDEGAAGEDAEAEHGSERGEARALPGPGARRIDQRRIAEAERLGDEQVVEREPDRGADRERGGISQWIGAAGTL